MNAKPDLPRYLFLTGALASAAIAIIALAFIVYTAWPVLQMEGLNFIFGTVWNYDTHQYGMWNFLVTTLMLTAVAIVIAFPMGLATAIYLAEFAPPWLDGLLSTLIELLVGIPSIVFGLFGFYVLREFFGTVIDPFIANTLGFIPFFHQNPGVHNGVGVLLAGTVLAIMILPTIVALSREAMRGVSCDLREASFALGATKWETISSVVIPVALAGITTGLILAVMRAMGETMAVVMLIGGAPQVPTSVLDLGTSMTSKILVDIGYYIMIPEGKSALFAIGAVLFLMEICFVAIMRFISRRLRQRYEGIT
jgi:phosphate transport system permease protein